MGEVEELMNAEWKLRRTNAPGIATPLIDKLIEAARRNGGGRPRFAALEEAVASLFWSSRRWPRVETPSASTAASRWIFAWLAEGLDFPWR